MWNYTSYIKRAYLVMPVEHNPRTRLWLKQPNYTPKKQDVFGFSEITDLPKETYRGNQLRHKQRTVISYH